MNLKKLLDVITFRQPDPSEMITLQMVEAKRALIQYTVEAEYLKSLQDFQRVRIRKLQELQNEIHLSPDTIGTNISSGASSGSKHTTNLLS